ARTFAVARPRVPPLAATAQPVPTRSAPSVPASTSAGMREVAPAEPAADLAVRLAQELAAAAPGDAAAAGGDDVPSVSGPVAGVASEPAENALAGAVSVTSAASVEGARAQPATSFVMAPLAPPPLVDAAFVPVREHSDFAAASEPVAAPDAAGG